MSLKLLPLMMSIEISDIIFYISSYKNPQDLFNISSHVKFSSSSTRASSNKKLTHNMPSSSLPTTTPTSTDFPVYGIVYLH